MPPPAAPAAQHPQDSSKAASSSSPAADASSRRNHPASGAAATGAVASTASTPPNAAPSNNGEANRSPLLRALHPHPGAALPPPMPLAQPRPLLTVAAVEAVMSAIPPPPSYGLEDLDRRSLALSDGTLRTYFALPLEPPPQLRQPLPPLPAHLLAPVAPPRLAPDLWAPPPLLPMPAPMPVPLPGLPGLVPKRKWEDQANGFPQGESSGRQQQQKPDEKRAAKQVKVDKAKVEKVETPVVGVDPKALKSSFLKMVKLMNVGELDKRNYRSNGKLWQLKCAVCQRDCVDLHALLNHAYHAKNQETRADHLGFHKALCVLMGWNYSVDPVHKSSYQSLTTADAEANQGDLILWPPTVIIENTYKSKNTGQKDGMSDKEMESKLREMGFAGADVQVQSLPAKEGQKSMQVKFPSSLDGLNKASQLVALFEREGHGRAAWASIRGIASTTDGANNPMVSKVGANGNRTWVLYGYLATVWDLELFDEESRKNSAVKSRKELDLED